LVLNLTEICTEIGIEIGSKTGTNGVMIRANGVKIGVIIGAKSGD